MSDDVKRISGYRRIGWQPIESALDGSISKYDPGFNECIVYNGKGVYMICYDDEGMGWYENGDGWNAGAIHPQPTHWLPIEDLLILIPVPE